MESEEAKEALVLVGFGSHQLKDMLEWIDTPQEIDLLTAFKKWPPVYREQAACELEDVQTACDFLKYLQDVILEYENKENTDGNDESSIETD